MKAYSTIRFALALVAVAGLPLVSGCRELLSVNNPERILEEELNDPKLVNILLNSAVGELGPVYDDLAWFSAILTDEAVNATNDYRSAEISQRIVNLAQANAGPYDEIQTFRAVADTVAGRLRLLVPNPASDLRLARALAYAGYGYLFMGEFLCEAPINLGPLMSADELTTGALPRFQEAIQIAQAGRTTANASVADTIINLSRIGAARAALQLGRDNEARAFATQVPADFRFWVSYTAAVQRTQNAFWSRITGANKNLGVHPLMLFLNNGQDPRVRHLPTSQLGHNRLTKLWVPFQPRVFSGYNASVTSPVAFTQDADIELASGLEARYIVAEVDGPTATTLQLVNERRAAGNEAAIALAGDALLAELREQKRRDFYLGARRLGDLRRYIKKGIGDFFPSGLHPNAEWGNYGPATCFLLTQDEINGNPNLQGYQPPF